jgi:hypothetical protein
MTRVMEKCMTYPPLQAYEFSKKSTPYCQCDDGPSVENGEREVERVSGRETP